MKKPPFDKDAALADAREGMSAAALQRKYGIAYTRATKIRHEALATQTVEAEAVDEELVWTLNVEIPEYSLDQLIRTLDSEECLAALLNLDPGDKCTALQFVVQRRMRALIGGPEAIDKVQRVAQRVHDFTANTPGRAGDTVRTESTFRVEIPNNLPASEEAPVSHV